MLLWIVFAVLAVIVATALTWPLLRSYSPSGRSEEADIAVYRDQLTSLQSDCERGVLMPGEAEAARAEIGRRLLDRARREPHAESDPRALAAAPHWPGYAIAALVPLLGACIYLAVGSPGLPGQPRAARAALPIEQASVEEIVTKVEARLRAKPDDGQGWDVIAPVYILGQRYDDAADAFAKAIALLGESPKRLAGFADATIRAGNGIVNDSARRAYERLLAIEPGRIDARFWLAMGKEQDGDLAGAAAGYRDLLVKAEADAPWRGPAGQRLEAIEERLGARPAGGAGPGAPVGPKSGSETSE